MTTYDVSPDGKRVVFAAADTSGHSRLWIAPLDQRTAPRQLPGGGIVQPRFGPAGDLVFVAPEGTLNYLYRSKPDASARQKVTAEPILEFYGLSPDSAWALAWTAVADQESSSTSAVVAYPTAGGPPLRICGTCWVGWPRGGKSIYLALGTKCYRVPLPSGKMFPPLPAAGIQSEADLKTIPGAKPFAPFGTETPDWETVALVKDQSTSAFVKQSVHRNLYRIPIP